MEATIEAATTATDPALKEVASDLVPAVPGIWTVLAPKLALQDATKFWVEKLDWILSLEDPQV